MADRDLRLVSPNEFPDGSETIPAPGDSRPVIKVYVRKGGSEDERTLSFRPPKEISQKELLDNAFAIDGNSAVYNVVDTSRVWDRDEQEWRLDPEGETLMDQLRDTQKWLVKWLGEKGYEVEFA